MLQVTGIYGNARKQLQQANEVLINAMGLLAFVDSTKAGPQLPLAPLADWLHDQQRDDGTYVNLLVRFGYMYS